jgi:hypothetical protein
LMEHLHGFSEMAFAVSRDTSEFFVNIFVSPGGSRQRAASSRSSNEYLQVLRCRNRRAMRRIGISPEEIFYSHRARAISRCSSKHRDQFALLTESVYEAPGKPLPGNSMKGTDGTAFALFLPRRYSVFDRSVLSKRGPSRSATRKTEI